MKRADLFILIVLSLALLSGGCRGTRTLEKGDRPTSLRHLVKLVEQNEPAFTTMNASNISIGVTAGDKKLNVSAALKIKTDSVILLSILPFMGIEMYSLELYPDRWMLYDKFNRTYYTDTYEYFYYKMGLKVDFPTLQSLFSARYFSAGAGSFDLSKAKYTPLESGKSTIETTKGPLNQYMVVNAGNYIEEVSWSDDGGLFQLTTTYKDYVPNRGVVFPRNIVVELFSGDNPMGSLDIKMQKITFNSELRLSLSDPERYKKGVIGNLMNSIK